MVDIKSLPLTDGKADYEKGLTRVKVTGNIIELVNFEKCNRQNHITKIDADHYILNRAPTDDNGELILYEIEHTENRAQGYRELLRTFAHLRDIINTNVTDVDKVHWCTLTYAENMQNLKKLYRDFDNFWRRFKSYCESCNYKIPEYIAVREPQERGAWHIHLFIIWECKAPFIPHDDFWRMWSPKGFKRKVDFVYINSLRLDDGRAIDNVGAYLTSYLTDTLSEDEHKQKKHARLPLYPTGMNIYSTSKNIKQPTTEYMSPKEAKKKASGATLTFEKNIELSDNDTGYINHIIYRYYNTKPTYCQEVIKSKK